MAVDHFERRRQAAVITPGAALTTLQRTGLYVGKAWSGGAYFQGTVAFIRIYNGIILSGTDVTGLYNQVNFCRAGFYGTAGSCTACASTQR